MNIECHVISAKNIGWEDNLGDGTYDYYSSQLANIVNQMSFRYLRLFKKQPNKVIPIRHMNIKAKHTTKSSIRLTLWMKAMSKYLKGGRAQWARDLQE